MYVVIYRSNGPMITETGKAVLINYREGTVEIEQDEKRSIVYDLNAMHTPVMIEIKPQRPQRRSRKK